MHLHEGVFVWELFLYSLKPVLLAALALVRTAHAFVILAGMAAAFRADVDAAQLAQVFGTVVTAACHRAVNGLIIHDKTLPFHFEHLLRT